MKVGLIGAGVIGQAVGARLLETNHDLTVYDRNPPKVAALTEKGASGADGAAAVGAASDYVIVSLNGADAVRDVTLGPEGVASTAKPGTMIIDMSSIDPVATRALAENAAAKGLAWVDAPLSGGAPKAEIGALTVMAGGEVEDVERARAVMDDLCANYTRMGPSGAGQTTKLINQVLCALHFSAVAEAVALAEAAGVDAAMIPTALKGGRADSAILQEFTAKFAARDYTPAGRIDNMVKDLNGVQDLAQTTGTPMPVTAAAAELHRWLTAKGFGLEDNAAMMKYFDR